MCEVLTMHDVTQAVLSFWFGELGDDTETMQPFWFKSTPEKDEEIRSRFQDIHERAKNGDFDAEVETADDYLAMIITLDQFPRNIYRGTANAFAGDPLARKWARQAIDREFDLHQPAPNRRMFFYLPFEHAENIDDQTEAVRLFEEMGYDELTGYAKAHHDVIAAYGRFPHRNAALGRENTADEEEYLSRPGAGF
ncbi:MAG: DUF924 family protein [Rhodospirillales bacterium]